MICSHSTVWIKIKLSATDQLCEHAQKEGSVITFHITVYMIKKTFPLVWEKENSHPVKPNVIQLDYECLLHCGVFFFFFFPVWASNLIQIGILGSM